MTARLGVVLVCWNGWRDTLECLESVLASDVALRVVVVDNASADGSADHIAAWAAGRETATAAAAEMARFSALPAAKPVDFVRLDRAAAEAGKATARVVLVDSGGNLGFAGGNNIGLRHLLHAPAIEYVWLLNNDTVAEPGAARALLARLDATPGVGMCGTVVRYYWRPDTVQALNGSRYDRWTGQSRGLGFGDPAEKAFDAAAIARATDFVLGASLAVSRAFVETVGPMEESYFLYFEEIDWATRGRARFVTAFADGAIVYHKEGGSIGSSGTAGGRSALSEYWLLRSRHAYVRRFQPWLLPLHWGLSAALIGRRLLRGQRGLARAMARAWSGQSY